MPEMIWFRLRVSQDNSKEMLQLLVKVRLRDNFKVFRWVKEKNNGNL